jgi:hypothetical protein
MNKDQWNAVERDDIDFQKLRARYVALGYKPSAMLPQPEKSLIPSVPDIKSAVVTASTGLASVAMVGAVAVAAYVAVQVFKK